MSAPPRATTSASTISRSFNTPLPVPLNRKKMSLQSVLQKGKAFLTPRNSSDSINQIKSYIFPTVDPAIDGEDCDHDCETCEVKLPKGWKIDTEEKLYGRINGWATHMLVATGKTDWVKDVADEKGSVMQAVRDCGVEPSNGKLMLSASNLPLPTNHNTSDSPSKQPTTILLLPAFTYIDNVTPSSVPNLITHYVNRAPTTTTPLNLQIPSGFPSSTHDFPTRPCPHKYLILMCSQRTRDARCGQSAPLLKREFERHLRPLGLFRDAHDERPGGCGIFFISHVGGHKFSANIMVYRRDDAVAATEEPQANGESGEGNDERGLKQDGRAMGEAAQCIWLARVRPEDCEGIVKFTLLQGKVVKPQSQLRGGFDRTKGLVSW